MTNEEVLLREIVTTPEKCGGFFTGTECEDYIKRHNVPENGECASVVIPTGTYARELFLRLSESESLMRVYCENPLEYVSSVVNTEYPDGRPAPEEWVRACVAFIDSLRENPVTD